MYSNKVLTNIQQSLSENDKSTARNNIGAISEAPIDDQAYARKNGNWEVVSGGGGDAGFVELTYGTSTRAQAIAAIQCDSPILLHVPQGSTYSKHTLVVTGYAALENVVRFIGTRCGQPDINNSTAIFFQTVEVDGSNNWRMIDVNITDAAAEVVKYGTGTYDDVTSRMAYTRKLRFLAPNSTSVVKYPIIYTGFDSGFVIKALAPDTNGVPSVWTVKIASKGNAWTNLGYEPIVGSGVTPLVVEIDPVTGRPTIEFAVVKAAIVSNTPILMAIPSSGGAVLAPCTGAFDAEVNTITLARLAYDAEQFIAAVYTCEEDFGWNSWWEDTLVLEAPIDGKQYTRKDGDWVEVTGGGTHDCNTFVAVLELTNAVAGNGPSADELRAAKTANKAIIVKVVEDSATMYSAAIIEDDGTNLAVMFTIGNEIFTWSVDGTRWIKQDTLKLVEEADKDGTIYGRKNGAWVEVEGGGDTSNMYCARLAGAGTAEIDMDALHQAYNDGKACFLIDTNTWHANENGIYTLAMKTDSGYYFDRVEAGKIHRIIVSNAGNPVWMGVVANNPVLGTSISNAPQHKGDIAITSDNRVYIAVGISSASDWVEVTGGGGGNVQSDWNETNSSSDAFIKNKPIIPSKTSQLENDSHFVSGTYKTVYSVVIDGRRYRATKIGNQLWLSENLDLKWTDLQIGETDLSTTAQRANYYNDDETTYGIDGKYKCGLLYNAVAARYLHNNKSTLLPAGWQVPSKTDFQTLLSVVGTDSAKLLAKAGSITEDFPTYRAGTDDYEFSAIGAGWKNYIAGTLGYYAFDSYALYWTNETGNSPSALVIWGGTPTAIATQSSERQLSIRLVMNLNSDGTIPDGYEVDVEYPNNNLSVYLDSNTNTLKQILPNQNDRVITTVLNDAPSDSVTYGRKNGDWVEVKTEIQDIREASSLTFEDALELAKKGIPIKNNRDVYAPIYQDSNTVFFTNVDVSSSLATRLAFYSWQEGYDEIEFRFSLKTDDVNNNIRGVDDSEIKLTYDSFNYVEGGFDGAADADGTITIKLERWWNWAFENIVDILGVEGLKRIKIVSNEYGDTIDDYVDEIEVTKVNFNLFTPGYLYRVNIFGYSATITEIPRYEESVTIGGKKYPVVTVGSTKWIAENLDLTWDGLSVGETGTISETTPCAWYYRNNEEAYGKNGRKCGLLYNINALNYLIANKSTLLPEGWDIASRSDFTSAINSDTAGGSVYALVKDTDWDSAESVGTNKTRISIVQAGERGTSDSFSSIGVKTSIWTKDDSSSTVGDKIFIQLENGERHDYHTKDVRNGFSIRLVQRASLGSSNTTENPPEEELP